MLDATPDEQSIRLRLGQHRLNSLRISCAGEGYHSGAEWAFAETQRPAEVEHHFLAIQGDYVCDLVLATHSQNRHVSRRVALSGAAVTLPLEHELKVLQ